MVSAYGNSPIETINDQINIAVKKRNIKKAESLFQSVFERKLTPTAYTYRCMMTGYNKSDAPKKTLQLYKKMEVAADQPIYHCLLTAYAKNKDFPQAKALFNKMQDDGFAPNTISYNCMLNACTKTNNFTEGYGLFQEMKNRSVARDSTTFNTLIYLCRRTDHSKEAQTIRVEMEKAGFTPHKVNAVYLHNLAS